MAECAAVARPEPALVRHGLGRFSSNNGSMAGVTPRAVLCSMVITAWPLSRRQGAVPAPNMAVQPSMFINAR